MKRFVLSVITGIFLSIIPIFLYYMGGGDFVRGVDLSCTFSVSSILLVGGFFMVFNIPDWKE